MTDPLDWQEIHSPTEIVTRKLTSTRRAENYRQRIVDARLWEAMDFDQQRACEAVYHAFKCITSGLGQGAQSFERRDPTYGDPWESDRGTIKHFWVWSKRAQRERIEVSAILSVIVFGNSLTQTDRDRRKRNGWSKTNLLEGLTLYKQLRGWR